MTRFIDLHLHTTCSDGISTPKELLSQVRHSGVGAFSVTDHDTLVGYHAIKEMLEPNDPELIPGIELSALVADKDLHLLAYCFDPLHEPLLERIDDFQQKRNIRGQQIVERLQSLGLKISFDSVEKLADGAVIGRPHIARAMYESGCISSYEEAFYKYIGNDKPAYVHKAKITAREAIKLVHDAGGVAVMAHPYILQMVSHIEDLAADGLDGIEVYYPTHSNQEISYLNNIADRFNLLVTGGSDFHGRPGKDSAIGSQSVPIELLEKIKVCAQTIRGNN